MSLDFLTVGADVEAQEERDNLGSVLKSGVYPMTIKMAYFDKAKSGANNVNIVAEREDGRAYKETVYLTSAAGKNYYVDKRSGKKQTLPGYNLVNTLVQVAADTPLAKAAVEKKMVKIYDYEKREEVPQERMVLTELTNVKVQLGVREIHENKMAKDDNGKYTIVLPEIREQNEIDKIFTADGLTLSERKVGKTEPEFKAEWEGKFKGKVKDKTQAASAAPTGAVAGAPASTAPALDLG